MDTSHRGSKEIYVGEGILKWIQPVEPGVLKVEDLYAFWPKECWDLIDEILSDRPDLQDRIKKYKKTRGVD